MAKNSNVIGIAAILLILAFREGGSSSGFSAGEGGSSSGFSVGGNGNPIRGLPPIEINGILNDLHKLTFIMNHMDNLGQMALHPSERPKLPPPSEMISRAIPDLGNIMEAVAPFLSALGSDSGSENINDIF